MKQQDLGWTHFRDFWSVAVYELDRRYGGPEEGGWWYDCGQLMRLVKVFKAAEEAHELCRRYNRPLAFRREEQRKIPFGRLSISSVNYSGGHYQAEVHKLGPPISYPEQRPYYE